MLLQGIYITITMKVMSFQGLTP